MNDTSAPEFRQLCLLLAQIIAPELFDGTSSLLLLSIPGRSAFSIDRPGQGGNVITSSHPIYVHGKGVSQNGK